MALTPDVTAGTIVQSSWGNQIRDRTVQSFASVAERNTWASPPKGAMAVTLDTLQVWQHNGTAWVLFVPGPKGLVAWGTDIGTNFAAAAPDQATGSFAAEVGRQYRFEASSEFWISAGSGTTTIEWSIRVAGAAIKSLRQTPSLSGGFPLDHVNLHALHAPAAGGATAFAARGTRVNGAGTVNFTASPTRSWEWAIYDVGPAISSSALLDLTTHPAAAKAAKPSKGGASKGGRTP